MDVWLREACKLIPEIPNPKDGAHIMFQEANMDYIRYDIRHKDGHRVYVVIFRNQSIL